MQKILYTCTLTTICFIGLSHSTATGFSSPKSILSNVGTFIGVVGNLVSPVINITCTCAPNTFITKLFFLVRSEEKLRKPTPEEEHFLRSAGGKPLDPNISLLITDSPLCKNLGHVMVISERYLKQAALEKAVKDNNSADSFLYYAAIDRTQAHIKNREQLIIAALSFSVHATGLILGGYAVKKLQLKEKSDWQSHILEFFSKIIGTALLNAISTSLQDVYFENSAEYRADRNIRPESRGHFIQALKKLQRVALFLPPMEGMSFVVQTNKRIAHLEKMMREETNPLKT